MKILLNGWQRLWLVLTFLFFAFATLIAYSNYESPTIVEDLTLLAELNNDQVTEVDIQGLGIVKFPSQMEDAEIEALISENYENNLQAIPLLAKEKMNKWIEKLAADAIAANELVRERNKDWILLSYGTWLGFVIFLYAIGWSIGWIRSGFRQN